MARYVPYIIEYIDEALGEGASLPLIEAFGGRRIAIPKRVGGRLVEVLGADIVRVLIRYFAGTEVDVPSRGYLERMEATKRLWKDALHSSLSANELAAKHGVTCSYAQQLRRKLRGKAANSPNPRKA